MHPKKNVGLVSNEQRFIWDIDTLTEILKHPTERNLIESSAILRRLLTDSGEPLLHKVARGRDFSARFVISGKQVDEALRNKVFSNPNLSFHWYDLSFGQMSRVPTRTLGLDNFLREPICHVGNTAITVKELINYAANVGGGVHQGTPRPKDNAEIIHTSANDFLLNGRPFPTQSMASIAFVTRNALYPLYLKVRS